MTEGKDPQTSGPSVVGRTTAIMFAVAGFALGVVIASVVALLIPDGGGGSSASSSTSTVPVQFTMAPKTTTTKAPEGAIGQPVTNDGIRVTINAVTTLSAVPRKDGDVPARPGAKIIRIDTLVENVGQKSIDLTCSAPLSDKLWDAQTRQFDHVDSLYEIPGNPGCNDGLQPGFSSPMSYLYEVPADAEPAFFGFADSNVDWGANTKFIKLS